MTLTYGVLSTMLLDIRKHPDDILEDLPYVSGHYLRSFMDSLNYVNSFDALLPCCALPSWLAGLILFSHLHAQLRSSFLMRAKLIGAEVSGSALLPCGLLLHRAN